MNLNNNTLYHIFNQGNNRQNIFLNEKNYHFFLWKMRAYLLPFGDIVAYCLMPNHYHWLFYVKESKVSRSDFRLHIDKIENLRRKSLYKEKARRIDPSSKNYSSNNDKITINESIGILQKSYTDAFNKEQKRTGSLFRQSFKSKNGWLDQFITTNDSHSSTKFNFSNENLHAINCLNYIHQNPVTSGLVEKDLMWKYSSALDYKGSRKGTLCNLKLGENINNYL